MQVSQSALVGMIRESEKQLQDMSCGRMFPEGEGGVQRINMSHDCGHQAKSDISLVLKRLDTALLLVKADEVL